MDILFRRLLSQNKMESYSYEDLNASFSLEQPLFGASESIDTLCETYLSNMEAYSSDVKHAQKSLFEEMEAFSKMEIHEWQGEVSRQQAERERRPRWFVISPLIRAAI